MKVHMLIDAVQSVGRFIRITAARVHDKNFLKSLELISHSMIVFDKAYNFYHQFALFKKMKQNFQLHYFYGENENAIRTQVWCTLIAQLLLTVVQKMAQTKKAFSVVASLIRVHLISMLDVYEMLRSTRRAYGSKSHGPPGFNLQMKLTLV